MSIQKHFKPLLKERLNQLLWRGYTEIDRYELLGWFNNQRLTHAIWKELQEEWEELLEEWEYDKNNVSKLKVVEDDEAGKKTQTFLLIDEGRLKDFSSYAESRR